MTERELHLTERNDLRIETAVAELAALHNKTADEIRRLIYARIAPYPPTAQCLQAIEKTRRELAGMLQ